MPVSSLVRRKSIDQMISDCAVDNIQGDRTLVRSLTTLQLTTICIGSTLGTGILALLATEIPHAGPAIWLSIILAAIPACLSALSYAEMTGIVPVTGSCYSYTYATMGEFIGWAVGWCLILEYGISVSTVASSTGVYVNQTLAVFGLKLPDAISLTPGAGSGGIFNLPAFIIVIFCMVLLIKGTKESAILNTVLVFLKVGIIAFFCVVAFTAFKIDHFSGMFHTGFMSGVTGAGAVLFFSYIGFDTTSTAGDEAINPTRDIPKAIMYGIIFLSIFYVIVAVAAVGARPANWFNDTHGLVTLMAEVSHKTWIGLIFSVGAIIAFISIILTTYYGLTRIVMSMARDGLVPKVFADVNPKTKTPIKNTIIFGVITATVASVIPLGALADAASIGTFSAFVMVNISVLILRYKRSDLERSFKVPFFPLTPILGTLTCIALMSQLSSTTWIVFTFWMLAGIVIYFGYGIRNSNLKTQIAQL